jgi:hypothetical protein
MIDEIRKQLEAVPFVPFSVRTSEGHEYPVPTVDHAYITPRGDRVISLLTTKALWPFSGPSILMA